MILHDFGMRASNIINKTSRAFHIYDESTGSIECFYPSKKKIKKHIYTPLNCSPTTYYVVTATEAERIRRSGGTLDNIAVIKDRALGRHNVEVVYLVWAKDPQVKVKLHNYNYAVNQ